VKYYTQTKTIHEEDIEEDIFKDIFNLHDFSRFSKINVSTLCLFRSGKRIPSEKVYLRLKLAVKRYLDMVY